MSRWVMGAIALLAIGSTGCSKIFFLGTAPAKTGWVYVVGSKNDRAQGWLCPSQPGQGRCKEIEIEVEDR